MKKKINAAIGSNSSEINIKLDGAIPLGIMNEEQYLRYKKSEIDSTETTNLVFSENGEDMKIIYTFNHPITKAKYNLVYDNINKMLMLIPDVSLNVDLGSTNFDLVGYAIGAVSVETKYENFNYKKSIDTNFKINLDVTKLDNLKNNIKVTLLIIPGASHGTPIARSQGSYDSGNDFVGYNVYPHAALKIKFTDEILNETLPVNILTSYNLSSDKIISNNYVLTEKIKDHIVFLSL